MQSEAEDSVNQAATRSRTGRDARARALARDPLSFDVAKYARYQAPMFA